jgi:hypothetical protein
MNVRFKCSLLSILSAAYTHAHAQSRYDDHELNDRFRLDLSAYEQTSHDTKIRIDSDVGIGTVLDLEDRLNVDDNTGTVLRLDGHYRFNRAHRLDFAWYHADRKGDSDIFDQEVRIGDKTFGVGSRITSETDFELFKLGYQWSFINVAPYEFYVGAGINVHRNDFKFVSQSVVGSETQVKEQEAKGSAPLPTVSFGMRYNLTQRFVLNWDYEAFAIKLGGYGGRFQESALSIEHNTWDHLGFGFGIINFNNSATADDGRFVGEFDSSYLGYKFYLKTYY